jgi:hypothetical protein
MSKNLYVQYGCGLSAPDGWLNFDASPTLRLQRIPAIGGFFVLPGDYPKFPSAVRFGDIVEGLPISDQSCKGVYCSHVLEHLALEDFRTALANTLRYLEPGGIFRLVLPALERLTREYIESRDDDAASRFMEGAYLGVRQRKRGVSGMLRGWLGNSAHLWMWDEKGMVRELRDAGFTAIRRAKVGDSADPRFSEVEDPDRWHGCLGIECRK